MLEIAGRKIGRDSLPYVIAEMSGNHNHSLDRALAITEAAAKSGAHALKLQTYTADTMTLDISEGEFFISEKNSLWKGNSLYKLYKQAYTPWEWHKPIFEKCKELGIMGFSTPFDETAVDFLESLDVPCYKIASFENNHLPLIKKVAKTGKPIIMSTGMASVAELSEAVQTARQNGCKDIILLKCTSSYPSTPENSNLLTIPHMQELFNCEVGISDHSLGIGVAVASVVLGSVVIEKHFTLSKADGGVDSAFSMEPDEMKSLVTETKKAWQALGKIQYGQTEEEKKSMSYRRSMYVAKDIGAGERFTKENIRIIRPGFGLHPRYYEMLLGKIASKALRKGTPVAWDLVMNTGEE